MAAIRLRWWRDRGDRYGLCAICLGLWSNSSIILFIRHIARIKFDVSASNSPMFVYTSNSTIILIDNIRGYHWVDFKGNESCFAISI